MEFPAARARRATCNPAQLLTHVPADCKSIATEHSNQPKQQISVQGTFKSSNLPKQQISVHGSCRFANHQTNKSSNHQISSNRDL